ncbi:hypothetical protein ABG79_02073 [Caloramator mitchellensis]|uniref:Uncharacterized protein n=1 Tax=Caloramator mitchellensis TaxID=908809 RepID=A0A0R3JRM8_CALMK|nr:hypothetical protein [Caloramator mitchellensis]KRQ86134.1 hypothetical protein ABG79_02073 [Caloramator mitchellensis]
MSRRCRDRHEHGDFNSLLALILIVTQFGRVPGLLGQGQGHGHDCNEGGLVDNSLLFIIALYLVICGCCPFKRSC